MKGSFCIDKLVPKGIIMKFTSTPDAVSKAVTTPVTTTYYVSDDVVVAQIPDENNYVVYTVTKSDDDPTIGSVYTLALQKDKSGKCTIAGQTKSFQDCSTSTSKLDICPKDDGSDTCILIFSNIK